MAKDRFGFGTDPTDSYITESIKEFGGGDIGYVIGALRYAKDKGIIHPDMSIDKTKQAMEENDLMSIGFDRNINAPILDYIWNEKWQMYEGQAKERFGY